MKKEGDSRQAISHLQSQIENLTREVVRLTNDEKQLRTQNEAYKLHLLSQSQHGIHQTKSDMPILQMGAQNG